MSAKQTQQIASFSRLSIVARRFYAEVFSDSGVRTFYYGQGDPEVSLTEILPSYSLAQIVAALDELVTAGYCRWEGSRLAPGARYWLVRTEAGYRAAASGCGVSWA